MKFVKKDTLRDSTMTGALSMLQEFLETTPYLCLLQDIFITPIIVTLTPCNATSGMEVEASEVQCMDHVSEGIQFDLVLKATAKRWQGGRVTQQCIRGDTDHQEQAIRQCVDNRPQCRKVTHDCGRPENSLLFLQLIQQQKHAVQHPCGGTHLNHIPQGSGLGLDGVEAELYSEALSMHLEQPQTQQPLHHQVKLILPVVGPDKPTQSPLHVVTARLADRLAISPESLSQSIKMLCSQLFEQTTGRTVERRLRVRQVTDHVMAFEVLQGATDFALNMVQKVRLSDSLGAFDDHNLRSAVTQKRDDSGFHFGIGINGIVWIGGRLVRGGKGIGEDTEIAVQEVRSAFSGCMLPNAFAQSHVR